MNLQVKEDQLDVVDMNPLDSTLRLCWGAHKMVSCFLARDWAYTYLYTCIYIHMYVCIIYVYRPWNHRDVAMWLRQIKVSMFFMWFFFGWRFKKNEHFSRSNGFKPGSWLNIYHLERIDGYSHLLWIKGGPLKKSATFCGWLAISVTAVYLIHIHEISVRPFVTKQNITWKISWKSVQSTKLRHCWSLGCCTLIRSTLKKT